MFKTLRDMLSTTARNPERDFLVVEKYMKDENGNIQDIIKIPCRATRGSAGYDFFNNTGTDIRVLPNTVSGAIATGIKVYMKSNEFLSIVPRSSLGFKYTVRLANTVGIIDSDYFNNEKNEGEIFVKLHNQGKEILTISPGDSFVQGIFENFLTTDTDKSTVGGKRTGGIGSTTKDK